MDGNPFVEMKQYIIDHGWCKRREENHRGQVCLIGAMDKTRNLGRANVTTILDIAIREFTGTNVYHLLPTTFNDARSTRKKHLFAVLDLAAQKWDKLYKLPESKSILCISDDLDMLREDLEQLYQDITEAELGPIQLTTL